MGYPDEKMASTPVDSVMGYQILISEDLSL
jgi:hypothetical protein